MNDKGRRVSPLFALGIGLLVVGIGALSSGNALGSRTAIVLGFMFLFIGYLQRGT